MFWIEGQEGVSDPTLSVNFQLRPSLAILGFCGQWLQGIGTRSGIGDTSTAGAGPVVADAWPPGTVGPFKHLKFFFRREDLNPHRPI